ncbi:MAG: TolC family outer membrane protein [Methylotenera sp.]|jgi:outer membrane protein|uniref:TolC family outer membrane protein n=1 Tax=Methylotenera sp. TaxID=2051956 RepID=UPI002723FD3F|nr:TolC family outer membrane protein [Methylotenera sp.]MDO9150565.1 TolC family outer membrane protein [Methylotenera sp.]
MLKTAQFLIKLTLLSAFASYANADDKPYSLIEVYQQALANDPTLASALSANQAAQEAIEQAKALYRPTLNLTAGATATQTRLEILSGNNPFVPEGRSNFESYNYGVQARQPIYRKDSLVQIDQSKVQVSRADKQLNLSKQELMLRVTQAYFDVLLAQDQIELIIAQKAAILSQLEQANANFEVGTATITDVNEAQARFDLVFAQEIAAVNQYQIAKHAVQAITGKMPEKLATVRTDMATNSLGQGLDRWLEVATQNNLNIQIQQDALAISTQEVERLRAGHLPTLDAVASYTNNYANGNPTNGIGSELKTAAIGFQLEIPLYLGGAVNSRVRQAVLNQQKAQDDIQIARRSAELETQRAYLNLSSSIAQVKAYEQALISSQSQVDSTKLGYEVGVRTSVDVLNAQQQLFSAKRDLLQARYSYLVNIIRLKATSGVVAEPDLADINQQLVIVGGR